MPSLEAFTAETGSIGVSIQDQVNVFTEPTDYMRVKSIDLNPEADKLVPDPEIGAGRDVTEIHQGSYKLGGDMETYLRPEAVGNFFYGAFGGYIASGSVATGAYLHNFFPTTSGNLPLLSIKKQLPNGTAFDYKDVIVDSFELELAANEFANLTFGLIGVSDEIGSPLSPTFETAPLLTSTKARITLGGEQISAKNVTASFNNNTDGEDWRIGQRTLGSLVSKRRELEVTLDVVLDRNSDLYQKSFFGADDATEAGFEIFTDSLDILIDSPIEIPGSSETYRVLLTIPNAVFMTAPIPASGDDMIVIPLTLKPIKENGVHAIQMKIWNGKALY